MESATTKESRPLWGRALGALPANSPVILEYHGFGSANAGNDPRQILIEEAAFRRQLAALRQAGYSFVTMSEIGERMRAGSAGLGSVAALTFDDGLMSLFEPLSALAAEGVPSTVYAVTGWIGGMHPAIRDPKEARLLDRDKLRRLVSAGVEIGAHSRWHDDFSKLSFDRALRDMVECRRVLESIVGRPVRSFAYPYGGSSASSRAAAREAGFETAVVEDRDERSEPFRLARAPIRRSDGWGVFTLKVMGKWPAVAGSVPGRAARAATRPVRLRIHGNGRSPVASR